jgi:hypothetical protein
MDREVTKHVHKKTKGKKTSKKNTYNVDYSWKTNWNFFVKQQQANFIATWASLAIRKVGNRFHYNFKVGLWVHPLGYKGVNLNEITQV